MTGILIGNVQSINVFNVTLSPVSVAATTTAEQTVSVPGIQVGDYVSIRKPTVQAGLNLSAAARVVSNGTLGLTFTNTSGAPIVPTAGESYMILIFRPQIPGSTNPFF